MPRRKPPFAWIILATSKPPEYLGFRHYERTWWKKFPTQDEALETAYHLTLLDIHGVVRKCRRDKPAKPGIPRESPRTTRAFTANARKIRKHLS